MTKFGWDPPVPEDGYGDANPPPGGEFSVETKLLIETANEWDKVAAALKRAWHLTAQGHGAPVLFGIQDALYSAGLLHMNINDILVDAFEDGYAITRNLANALVETANDFEGTDTTQGDNFRAIERRA